MNDERARLFIALELPAPARRALVEWGRDVVEGHGLRPVPPQSMHVTLCFLGSVPAAGAAAIGGACAAALARLGGPAPLPLSVGRALWLPPRRPRVLAVGLGDASGGLCRAQSALADALIAGGWYEPEARRFLPHVTVARVARGGRLGAVELREPERLEFEGRRVTLFRSHLGGGGARYEALRVIKLG